MTDRSFPLWRNRDYMLLWGGQIVSSLGDEVSGIALPLLILALTGSPAQAGAVGAVRGLPFVLLSLPAGALIDRWDRKRVMIVCDTGRGIAALGIAAALWGGHLSMAQIYLTGLVMGVFFTFFNLAEMACLPNVVEKEQIPAATAQNLAASRTCDLAGPPIGGFLYSMSRAVPFLVDAISYAVSVISLRFVQTDFQRERTGRREDLRGEIAQGLRWVWRHRLFRFLAVMNSIANMVTAGGILVVIVLAKGMHASPVVIGAMFSIGSVGGILGSLFGARIQKRVSFGAIVIACFGVQTLLFPLQAVAPNPVALGCIAAGLFSVGPVYNVALFSYRLSIVPDHLLGRVTSSVRLVATGTMPLGSALAGLLLQAVGPRPTVLIFSACLLFVAVVSILNSQVRHAPQISEMAAEEATAATR